MENADEQISGVLLDSRGRVGALWSSFASGSGNRAGEIVGGLPIEHVEVMLDHLRREAPWRSLEVTWQRTPLSVALRRGLPESWLARVEEHDKERRQMLTVSRTVAATPASTAMRPGDLLLSVNGSLATRPHEVERAVAGQPRAEIRVWRNQEEVELEFDTVELGWEGLREVLFWAGALVQNPQRAMAAQMSIKPQGVALQHYTFGSPAHRYLLPTQFLQIISVNGKPTDGLDAFGAELQRAGDDRIIRLEGITRTGATRVATVKLDPGYWPSSRLLFRDGEWERVGISD